MDYLEEENRANIRGSLWSGLAGFLIVVVGWIIASRGWILRDFGALMMLVLIGLLMGLYVYAMEREKWLWGSSSTRTAA